MADEIELEKTYLVKYVPEGLRDSKYKDIIDIYLPSSAEHPKLRIRKDGDKMMITRKEPVNESDSSKQLEQTIQLTGPEYDELSSLKGKRIEKRRYYYSYNGREAQVDAFSGALKGLVLMDFEFEDIKSMAAFEMPDFCLADVTQEKAIAGGILTGKGYKDIEADLARYDYSPLSVPLQE